MRGTINALFACALALCPPGFRREYGAAMRDDFLHAFDDERTVHGNLGAIAYAGGAVSDLLITSLREYAAMLFRDFVYALRALRKTPSFTAIVVVTLALAIGANAAVFSILHASVLAPLPYADAQRLVALDARRAGMPPSFSLPDFADVMRRTGAAFVSGAAFRGYVVTLTGRGVATSLVGTLATPRFFATFGVRPEIGRFADDADGGPGAAKTVVISDGLWRRDFGSERTALGALLRLDGVPYRILGVAPADFQQPRIGAGFAHSDFWVTVPEDGNGTNFADRGAHFGFRAAARLAPGVSLAGAQTMVDAVTRELARRYPDNDKQDTVSVMTLTDSLVGSARGLLFALFAAVGAVLLVACANVANLFLSRAASREREFSVRIAVGASRGRIIAQLLVETFVLATAGGAIGIAIACAVVRAFISLNPANIPRADLTTIDATSVAYTFGVVAFCTVAAGLAPALASSQRDVAAALKSAGRGGDGSRGIGARNALVACEIAMTLALVVSAGLVVRSFVALTSQPLGFTPANASVLGPINLLDPRFKSESYRARYMDRVTRLVRGLSGVRHADWGLSLPFTSYDWKAAFGIVGRAVPPADLPSATVSPVGGDLFAAMGVALLEGRTFDGDDDGGSRHVVIVNRAFARRFFPDDSVIGAQIVPNIPSDDSAVFPTCTIVGVVADVRTSFSTPPEPTIYLPAPQSAFGASNFVVAMSPGANADGVARAIAAFDPLLPQPTVTSYDALIAGDVGTQRLSVAGLSALALVALALSIAGIFAVVSYGVAQRTHEFGVRMALGADARQIVRAVLGGAMRIAFTGIVLGLIVAGAGTRLLGEQLYDTQPLDPLTFGSVTVLVVLAALVAALVPARRATQVDPIVALRYE